MRAPLPFTRNTDLWKFPARQIASFCRWGQSPSSIDDTVTIRRTTQRRSVGRVKCGSRPEAYYRVAVLAWAPAPETCAEKPLGKGAAESCHTKALNRTFAGADIF